MTRCAALAVILVAVCGAPRPAAAQSSATTPTATAADAPTRPGAYVIGVDDQVSIRVADNPDIGGEKPLRVDASGELKLPMIGRIQAAGLTAEQLEAALISRYKVFLNEPDVLVTVAETRSQPVSVIGAVQTPGVRQLDGRKTLVEVLLGAGGVTEQAGPTVTVRRRIERGRIPLPDAKDDPSRQFSVAEIDLRALLDGRYPASDIGIEANDVIVVSKAEVVFVVGEVGSAGPVPLKQGSSMSVLEAVSTSGGVLRSGAPGNARILRAAANGQARPELPVDVKKIMAGKAPDQRLFAGDILVIPDSPGKRAATRAIDLAIQTGLIFATYGAID